MARVALLSVLALGAHSQNVTRRKRGFVRTAMNAHVDVATFTDEDRANTPSKHDWSEEGGLTKMKDQGDCGSCWAFSAISGIESGVFMTTGKLPEALSTQQLISCDSEDGGCDGGDLPSAFHYVNKEGGIDTESHYPDKSHNNGKDGKCKSFDHVVKVSDYKFAISECDSGKCNKQDEDTLMTALHKHGPLSICVNANDDWDDYRSGVMTHKCSGAANDLDHCVQLVGYDKTASTPYWKLRNSWGTDWGENGFIRLPIGTNACGLADEAMFVVATVSPSPGPSPSPSPSPSPHHHCRRRRCSAQEQQVDDGEDVVV